GGELLICRERRIFLSERVLRGSDVKLGFVISWIAFVDLSELLDCFFVVCAFKVNAAELEDGRNVFGPCLVGRFLGVLLDCALQEPYSRFAVVGQSSLDEVLERSDGRLGRVVSDLIA